MLEKEVKYTCKLYVYAILVIFPHKHIKLPAHCGTKLTACADYIDYYSIASVCVLCSC